MNNRHVVVLPFGTEDTNAVLVYDRITKICVITANSLDHLADAVATARTLKADNIHIIAPPGAEHAVGGVRISETMKAYELD